MTDRPTSDLTFLQPYFLGPAGENDQLLEGLVVEFLRDHAFWRRNFHPEDGFRITADARNRPDFLAFQARTRAALYELSADLKRAVPFFHPRYVGHMNSDQLIPGLVARILTTLYNPNNVTEEAAPVTLEKELQVGEQLAGMFGFSCDEGHEPCAWGHLTSGGTVANYEALWNLRSLKFYGIALQQGAAAVDLDPSEVGPLAKPLASYSKWELLNLSIDETIALRREVAAIMREQDARDFYGLVQAVRSQRIESLGTAAFFLQHTDLRAPQVLVSAAAHYSWAKAMKVLGLGTANLIEVRVDSHMRMDLGHLAESLGQAFEERIPVLAVVGTLGTTEFGTVDPIHGIVVERNRWRERGMDFGIHVDGAWGGYLTTVFRRPDGSFRPREEVAADFRYFPGGVVYDAFRALAQVDSITVDPHKMGYVSYAAGAFVARNREVVDFISQEAAYVFDLGDAEEEVPTRDKLRNLGQYILEGSKPGAAAAAVHVTHRVLPLDCTGFGRLLAETIRSCERFFASVARMTERLSDRVRLFVPFEPDSNLICLAVNPVGNNSVARMNRFGRDVYSYMKVDARKPVQMETFIGSHTLLHKEKLPGAEAHRILEALGLDPTTFRMLPEDPGRDADHLFILRHTLMNPWMLAGPGETNYVDLYWEFLEEVIDRVLEGEGPAE